MAEGYLALQDAARKGLPKERVAGVNLGGVNPNETRDGFTALMFAAKHGHPKAIPWLMRLGAKVDAADDEGNTALMHAAAVGDVEAVKMLCGSDSELEKIIFHCKDAARCNRASCKGLPKDSHHLILDDDKFSKNSSNSFVATCEKLKSHYCVPGQMCQSGVIEILDVHELRSTDSNKPMAFNVVTNTDAKYDACGTYNGYSSIKANVNKANKRGETPLMSATSGNFFDVVKLLVEHGADLDTANKFGETALIMAAKSSNKEIVEFFIGAGSCVETPDNKGNTALMHAARTGCVETVQLLVNAGAMLDKLNVFGESAMFLACSYGDVKTIPLIKILAEAGADVSLEGAQGDMTYLQWALLNSRFEIAKFLMRIGALFTFLKTVGDNDTVALDLVSSCMKDLEVLKLVVKQVANRKLENGLLPFLTQAVKYDNALALEIIMNCNANINQIDIFGGPPLLQAVRAWSKNCVQILLQAGGDVNMRYDGLTALEEACSHRNPQIHIISDLMKAGAHVGSGFHHIIDKNAKDCVQKMILLGALPTVKDISISRYQKKALSPLALAFLWNKTDIVRYLVSIWFFNEFDVIKLSQITEIRDSFPSEGNRVSEALFSRLYSAPWSLQMLAFVKISTVIGYAPGRDSKVQSLGLPEVFKRKLLFQDTSAHLPVFQWPLIDV